MTTSPFPLYGEDNPRARLRRIDVVLLRRCANAYPTRTWRSILEWLKLSNPRASYSSVIQAGIGRSWRWLLDPPPFLYGGPRGRRLSNEAIAWIRSEPELPTTLLAEMLEVSKQTVWRYRRTDTVGQIAPRLGAPAPLSEEVP